MIAIKKNNLELAKFLIKHPETNLNMLNDASESALILAVINNQKEIIELILKDERFDPKISRLNYAFVFANCEISKYLCSLCNLDVNQFETIMYNFNFTSKTFRTNALHHAVEINDIDKIDMIINHPSFDIKKSEVNKAIFIAAKENNINVFGRLISLIDNDINLENDDHESLLSYASKHLSIDIVEFIINNEHFDSENEEIIHSFVDCYSNSKTEPDSPEDEYIDNPYFEYDNEPIWKIHDEALNKESLPERSSKIKIMKILLNYDNEHAHLMLIMRKEKHI